MIRDKQIALYLAMGFELIPLRGGDGEHTSKKPLEGITWKDKVKYKGRIIDPRETADLLRSIPESNIGIATGERSGLAVVDIDTGQDIEQARKVLSSLSLPEDTATVTTGRGLHFWYKTSGQVKSIKRPGEYEIKGNGGYVVAPPSTHASGRIYAFLQDRGLEVIKAATFPDTVTRPVTLPVTLQGPDTRTPGGQGKVIRIPGPGLLSDKIKNSGLSFSLINGPDCIRQIIDHPIGKGKRHDVLLLLYNLMTNNGKSNDSEEVAGDIVRLKNSRLDTPQPDRELQAGVFSGKLYRHTCVTIRNILSFIPVKCDENCKFNSIRRAQMLLGRKAEKVFRGSKTLPDFWAWLMIETGEIDPNEIGPGRSITWGKFGNLINTNRHNAKDVIARLRASGFINGPGLFPVSKTK